MKNVILFFFVFIIPFWGYSESIYIAQTAQGSDTGVDAANAHSVAWFNTATNWGGGAGEIDPGDTVILNGTITDQLVIQLSGTSGNPITILFAEGAKMSKAHWGGGSGDAAIYAILKDYIIIDGGSNGIIETTANGESLANQQASTGVNFYRSNNIVVKNLTIGPMYVRSEGTDIFQNATGITFGGWDNLTGFRASNNTIFDAYIGINTDYGAGCSDYEIDNNEIYNCNWGGRCGDRSASSTMTGLIVRNNTIYNFSNWNETASNRYHHNGFYAWAESGGNIQNMEFYGNTIGPNYGGSYATSGLFLSGNWDNAIFYNNVFRANTSDAPSNGFITIGSNSGWGNTCLVYNNTFSVGGAGNGVQSGAGYASITIKNNIFDNVATAIFYDTSGGTLTSDNNLFNSLSATIPFRYGGSFQSLATWQSAGRDLNSVSGDPLLDGSYNIGFGSPAIDAGENLSAEFTVDKDNNYRGSLWDIGAYEYSRGAFFRKTRSVPSQGRSVIP